MSTRVLEILSRKSGPRAWVPLTSQLHDALRVMDTERVDWLAVLQNRQVRGVVSRRKLETCNECLAASYRAAECTTVAQIMATSILVVEPEISLRALLQRMSAAQASYAVGVAGDRLVGLAPLRELCLAMAQDLDDEVTQLTSYICGSWPDPAGSRPLTLNARRA